VSDIQQLVTEVAQVTGAELPHVLDGDSPVLRDEALSAPADASPYLVGLIGGKEVGKSALVNALVGQRITDSTSYGPGTEIVVAYVHHAQVPAIKPVLDREAPGRYQIVVHSLEHLKRQILLDLPDIDSQFESHLELTRRMLRHMLFPIWIQSIEKYADQQPQKLLAAVAAGNDPANFLFVLNKADQLNGEATEELRDDFAARIARTLGTTFEPMVYLISAIRPDEFDLPTLREKLSQQKSAGDVKQSIQLAGKQRERSMLTWLDQQRLPERVQRLARLQREAEELTSARLAVPVMESVVPRLLDDAQHRAAMVDEVMSARVARWPIVNVLHTLLLPLTSLWRQNVGAAATPESLVDVSLTVQGRPVSAAVQSTFALLQQTHPLVSPLYRGQRLWESAPADAAVLHLRDALTRSLQLQRGEAVKRLARRGVIAPLIRWLLTIGAVLWFPIIQPVLEVILRDGYIQSARGAIVLAVQLLSAAYLLKSAGFLAIWFLFLWLVLRWDTQRKVTRLLHRWRSLDGQDASMNTSAAALAWVDELLDPIRTAREREESLVKRADEARKTLATTAAA
jgi:GTP-binding protein EngB required for normal cell division